MQLTKRHIVYRWTDQHTLHWQVIDTYHDPTNPAVENTGPLDQLLDRFTPTDPEVTLTVTALT